MAYQMKSLVMMLFHIFKLIVRVFFLFFHRERAITLASQIRVGMRSVPTPLVNPIPTNAFTNSHFFSQSMHENTASNQHNTLHIVISIYNTINSLLKGLDFNLVRLAHAHTHTYDPNRGQNKKQSEQKVMWQWDRKKRAECVCVDFLNSLNVEWLSNALIK